MGPWDCKNGDEFKQPKMTFVIDGKDFELPSHHWSQYKANMKKCTVSVMPLTISAHHNENMFILGNTFMQLYYTIFNRKHNSVGFAKAVHKVNEIIPQWGADHKVHDVEVTPKILA